MGCFDSTCAISRTAIHESDEILIVALDSKLSRLKGWSTYELYNYCCRYEHSKTKEEWKQEPTPFRFLGIGQYNSYGTIENFDNNAGIKSDSWWEWQFLVHKSVVEGLLDKKLDPDNLENDVIELIEIAFLARVQLAGNILVGVRHFDKEELDLQRKVINLSLQVLDKHSESIVEYDELSDDELSELTVEL